MSARGATIRVGEYNIDCSDNGNNNAVTGTTALVSAQDGSKYGIYAQQYLAAVTNQPPTVDLGNHPNYAATWNAAATTSSTS